jgi:RNA polymerase sigma-70 factor (ECF subfamily)
VERCRVGDEWAWHELVGRHTRRVFGTAYRFCGRVDEAEDLTQEIFVKVYQSLARYDPHQGAFGTWLATVARHHAIDDYRRRREERSRRVGALEDLDVLPGSGESPHRQLEREERRMAVRRGLAALPSGLREPLLLCDLQELPYADAAEALGVPLGTLKSRINRGRLELARRLLGRRSQLEEA